MVNSIPYERLSSYWAIWLCFCLFYCACDDVLHVYQVNYCSKSNLLNIFDLASFRMIHSQSVFIKAALIIVGIFYFLNHFAHLSVGSFDYAYNMKANVCTGVIGGIGWIGWCSLRHKHRPYAWKMFAFQLLAAASLSLELLDFPPILWTFDAHSLWHLSTAPLTILLYRWVVLNLFKWFLSNMHCFSFIIDDCKSLRENMLSAPDDKEKLI